MTYFTDANNALYFLDTADAENYDRWLPPGVTTITDAEAALIQNPPPTLAQAQIAKCLIIEVAASNAIINGIPSSALGVAHIYPSGQVDQMNLTALVLRSTLPGFTSAMVKTLDAGWLSHTATQIQQVGIDVEAFISTQLQHSAAQQAAIMAATTVAEVQSVTW